MIHACFHDRRGVHSNPGELHPWVWIDAFYWLAALLISEGHQSDPVYHVQAPQSLSPDTLTQVLRLKPDHCLENWCLRPS